MSQSLHQQHSSTPTSHPFHLHQQQQQQRYKDSGSSSSSKCKNKFLISKSLIEEDVPPPLPQRNPPRQLLLDLKNGNASLGQLMAPVSDLDRATSPQMNRSPSSTDNSPSNNAKSKRSKAKAKALSDPKMSTQMFLQMESSASAAGGAAGGSIEVDGGPPPLPPRLPGMMTEDMSRGSCQNLAQPNSMGSSAFNYPLVATTTAVQSDNLKNAFPLSQRPNIVQQLQQYQQQQQQHQLSGGQATAVSS